MPTSSDPNSGPPPASRWARRKPEAAARLEAAKAALADLSNRLTVPAENLLTPDTVRRLCWDWQPPADPDDVPAAVEAFLADAGARHWQRELTVPILSEALQAAAAEEPPEG
jgi:ribonuclease D